MSIKIRTEKVVTSNCAEARKVLKIEALGINELPKKYLDDSRSVFYHKTSYSRCIKDYLGNYIFDERCTYDENIFQERIEKVKIAGSYLREVNKELKEKRAAWNGEETFII